MRPTPDQIADAEHTANELNCVTAMWFMNWLTHDDRRQIMRVVYRRWEIMQAEREPKEAAATHAE
jgi:hypothetical protein